MKKFLNLAFVAGAALTMGMTSCSKENSGDNGTDSKMVSMRLVQANVGDGTRAPGLHVDASTTVVMSNACIYFATNGGDIMSHCTIDFTLGGKNLPYDGTAKTVGIDQITAGTSITSIPGSVTKVAIIGNLPGGTYPTTGNLSQFYGATYVAVASLYDATGKGVAKVPLYGEKGLTPEAGENQYSCEIDIEPIAARIEIGAVSGNYSVGAVTSNVKSFTLEGIYINRYYTTMGFNCVNKSSVTNHLSDASKYNGAVAGSAYTALDEILSDYTALVAQSSAPVNKYGPIASADENDDVWGYNLLAPTGGDTPSIVVRLNDVVTTDGSTDDATTYAGTKFLTVRNMYLSSAPTTPISTLVKRNVYRIKALKFAEIHLTDNPESNLIDIELEATVMSWIPNDVDYDYN